ncbi:MAG TPA: pyridoxamine 5'-phosphate oxidase family protein [candidate division Zixibacteria bacterium]|nr:pyridoxamine 5'-phosphate oxidase family protein [candidate division Zixibacteria bacterium]
MTKKDIKEIAKELIGKSPVVYLATINENNEPEIRAVENLRCRNKFPHEAAILEKYEENPMTNYISTNTSSKKIKQIEKNKTVALYYSIPEEYKGIMMKGKVEILNDLKLKKEIWVEGSERYYPKGYSDPDFTILRIEPNYLKSWYGLKYGIMELEE